MNTNLQQLGFTNHESAIYLALIDLGSCGAGEIIRTTSLHRNIVYETLDRLVAKGYVSQFKLKKVAQFRVTDPERILDNLKSTLSLAEEIIPALSAKAGVKQDIVVYEGIEGFQNFSFHLIDSMNPGDTYYIIGSVGNRWYELMGDLLPKYYRSLKKKNLQGKSVIYHQADRDQETPNYEVRMLPHSFEPPADMVIWNNSIALQCLVEPFSVIEIKNPVLAQTYRTYFHLLWSQGKLQK